MQNQVWTNPRHPQTLQIFVLIIYFRVIFGLVFGLKPIVDAAIDYKLQFLLPFILIAITMAIPVLSARAIANDRWWGYIVSLIFAAYPFVLAIIAITIQPNRFFGVISGSLIGGSLIGTIFAIAMLALLIHPLSRNYVKSYFVKRFP